MSLYTDMHSGVWGLLGFRLVARQLSLIPFSKWRLVFPSSSLLSLPHRFKVMLAFLLWASWARSHSSLTYCLCLPFHFLNFTFIFSYSSSFFLITTCCACFTLNIFSLVLAASHTSSTGRVAFQLSAHTLLQQACIFANFKKAPWLSVQSSAHGVRVIYLKHCSPLFPLLKQLLIAC